MCAKDAAVERAEEKCRMHHPKAMAQLKRTIPESFEHGGPYDTAEKKKGLRFFDPENVGKGRFAIEIVKTVLKPKNQAMA